MIPIIALIAALFHPYAGPPVATAAHHGHHGKCHVTVTFDGRATFHGDCRALIRELNGA